MRAEVGDRLHVHGGVVGRPDHTSEIIEVRGRDGEPPYLVRRDDGHRVLVFPGTDASVERRSAMRPPGPNHHAPAPTSAWGTAGGLTTFRPVGDEPSLIDHTDTKRVLATSQWHLRWGASSPVVPGRAREPSAFDDPCNYLG